MLSKFTRRTLQKSKNCFRFTSAQFSTNIKPTSTSNAENGVETIPQDPEEEIKYFRTHQLLHLTQPIEEVRHSVNVDRFKIFLHSATAFSLFFTPYTFIAPLFCWFASSSVIRLRAISKQADQMIYRIDMSEDREWVHYWTGLGGKDKDYTFKGRLEGGFDIIGTRIEQVEGEIRQNYSRFYSKP